MGTKLIIVEGIPGAGKSSTAHFIKDYLQGKGVQTELFFEGNLEHPADCESVAYFTLEQFEELITANADYERVLRAEAVSGSENVLLSYGKLRQNRAVPEELLSVLSDHDVYELPVELFCNFMLQRWRDFAARQQNSNSVVIFECCFLQNPMCKLFVQHNEREQRIAKYILDQSRLIETLNPVLVYLNPFNIDQTIHKAIEERPESWLDFVVWYHTQQGYGRKEDLQGVQGYIEVLKKRHFIELALLDQLPMDVLSISNPQDDWEKTLKTIADHLDVAL